MMKYVILLYVIQILSGCRIHSVKYGVYVSQCRLYRYAEVKLNIKPDSTFQYVFPFHDNMVNGKWDIRNDTLLLYSNQFFESSEPYSPKLKRSNIEGWDAYIIRRKTLKIINVTGVSEDCPLLWLK